MGFESIYVYTRKQAIEDGVLVDISQMAKEAGFKYPTAITSTAWHKYVVPDGPMQGCGQSIEGRLWDVLVCLNFSVKKGDSSTVLFMVNFLMEAQRTETVQLKAICGPGDNAEPVITIMMPNED